MQSRLHKKYQDEVVKELRSQLKDANVNELPKLEKVVLNVGIGKMSGDSRALEVVTNTLRKITGQQPLQTKAKHSIAGFKLREGTANGIKVTLRRERMYEFLDRLISVVLPRTRDFRGLALGSFDPHGNYSIGISDQSVFPELSYEETTFVHGLQINIVTSTNDPEVARILLTALGFPFEKPAKVAAPAAEAGVK